MKSKKEIARAIKKRIKALNSIKEKNDFLITDINNLKTELYYLRRY